MPQSYIGTTKVIGKEYRYWFCGGLVLENKVWTQTDVYGGSNSDGSVSVSSQNHRKSELWLVPDVGVEKCVELTDVKTPIRAGQAASVVVDKRLPVVDLQLDRGERRVVGEYASLVGGDSGWQDS